MKFLGIVFLIIIVFVLVDYEKTPDGDIYLCAKQFEWTEKPSDGDVYLHRKQFEWTENN